MRMIALAAAFAALGASPARAQTVDQLQRFALSDETAYTLVEDLTTRIGPRPAGSEADRAARTWALQQFRALGFKNVREEPFELTVWTRGREEAAIVLPGAQPLAIAGLGLSVATPPQGIEADVVRVASLDALEALPTGALAGKIAFIDGERATTSRLGGNHAVGSERRTGSASVAARKGALAVLVRSASSTQDRFAHTGGVSYTKDAPQIPAAALPNADSDQLARLFALGERVRVRLAMGASSAPGTSGNVIAEVPGTDRGDEIVLLGAHLDSWDQGTGALDDGAGVAIVMAAAKAVMNHGRPRRTIRVVLFGAEETSLAGAAAYTARHKAEKHVIATEADLGAARVWGFYTGVPDAMLPTMDRLQAALAPLGIERGHNRASGGEDLYFLKKAGVPVASLVQDGTRYFDYHHTPNDTLDKIDRAELRQNVAAFATFAFEMANR